MRDPVVTLTTDFGAGSPYVAAMKGAILSVHPQARIIDLSHRIPPQDIRTAAYFLLQSIPYFPSACVHCVVVDPGVGTTRAALYVELSGRRLVCPDNGCWTYLPRVLGPGKVIRLERSEYWQQPVSPTFHGRDIFGPVAGWLSRGLRPECLGPLTDEWVRLHMPPSVREGDRIQGEVIFVDDFGNLITNIEGTAVSEAGRASGAVGLGKGQVARWVRTYGEASPGELVVLNSSGGWVEIAVCCGSAARRLNAGLGTKFTLRFEPAQA